MKKSCQPKALKKRGVLPVDLDKVGKIGIRVWVKFYTIDSRHE